MKSPVNELEVNDWRIKLKGTMVTDRVVNMWRLCGLFAGMASPLGVELTHGWIRLLVELM